MKKLSGLMLFLCLHLIMQAQQTSGIKWTEGLSWDQVRQKAKKENKYIFVDCYATWCGPCKWMDENIYKNDTIGNYFNDKFISVKVQMDTSKSDNDLIKGWYADASKIKNKCKVDTYPSYLFFSPNGDIVHRDAGAKVLQQFISVATDALNPERQYYIALEKYRRNELDTAYMKMLARNAKKLKEDGLAHKIANDYINRLSINALFTKDNLQFMDEFTRASKDRGFIMFRDSAKRISETNENINEDRCKNFVLAIINKEEIKPYCFAKKGKPDWKKIKSNLKKYGILGEEAFTREKPGIIFKTEIIPALKINSDWTNNILPLILKQNLGRNAEFVVGSTVVYYINGVATFHTEKDCKNLVAAATYYADSFSTFLHAPALNTWAWTLFENSNDKVELRQALEWSKRSNEMEPGSPEFLDTYANLLYKLGHVQEAIVWQEKAVEAAEAQAKKSNSTPMSVFRESLGKMKKSEKTWPEK